MSKILCENNCFGIFFLEYDSLYLEISQFVHFIIEILSHGSNNVHIATSFKILNDIAVCSSLYTIRSVIFNLHL